MLIADVLITDYSSIVFDYLFLKRPVILYAPDHDKFVGVRGFYTPYEELPGRIVKDEKELYDALCDAVAEPRVEDIEKYLDKYLEACDGHATERILQTVQKWCKVI